MDSLFFLLSKLYWLVGSPDHLLLILLTLGLAWGQWGNRPRPRLRLLWALLISCWLIALYPLGNLLLYPLESRFPNPVLPAEEELAGVIVLGGPEHMASSFYWNTLETNEAAERLLVMDKLLQYYPDLPVIYTSGSASIMNQQQKGADIVKGFFTGLAGADRIIYERQSRNTYENAKLSKALINPDDPRPWLLVTSAFHMPRSVGVFRQQGIKLIPYCVDHWSIPPSARGIYFNFSDNLASLKMGFREWVGLTAYWLSGKTSEWVPAPKQTHE